LFTESDGEHNAFDLALAKMFEGDEDGAADSIQAALDCLADNADFTL
jgi:hypothetical protein